MSPLKAATFALMWAPSALMTADLLQGELGVQFLMSGCLFWLLVWRKLDHAAGVRRLWP